MDWKKYFYTLCFLHLMILFVIFCVGYIVDPIGICGGPVIRGFNHYKVKQELYHDIFKPYEYIREKPDIVYIGGSQIDRGFISSYFLQSNKKVYNMGINNSNLWDLLEYLRFIYKVHKPEKVFLGIGHEYFQNNQHLSQRPNYSPVRLQNLTGNWFKYCKQFIKDVWASNNVYVTTVLESFKHKETLSPYQLGWNQKRGAVSEIERGTYYYYLDYAAHNYQNVNFSLDALDCFKCIVRESQEAGVQLIVFFPPMSIDYYIIMMLRGDKYEMEKIKYSVSQEYFVLDFDTANLLSINRNDFEDFVHFRASLGEKMKPYLERDNPALCCGYRLTEDNIDAVLEAENADWEQWATENREYVEALKECIETGRKLKVGEFAKYIGF